MFTKELFAAILFGITCGSLAMIFLYLWIPSLPRRQRVFIEQCCRRFKTIFTENTPITINRKDRVENIGGGSTNRYVKVVPLVINIPNALIVSAFVICCLSAIILLP